MSIMWKRRTPAFPTLHARFPKGIRISGGPDSASVDVYDIDSGDKLLCVTAIRLTMTSSGMVADIEWSDHAPFTVNRVIFGSEKRTNG